MKWVGICCEIKDINPPQSIREDMEKQMTAEREKRSVILTSVEGNVMIVKPLE